MQLAPRPDDWKTLRTAVLALIAVGVTGRAKAFLKAVREAKAAALMLLYALARSLCAEGQTRPRIRLEACPATGRGNPLNGSGRSLSADLWRNPPAVEFRFEGGRQCTAPHRRPTEADPQRLNQRVANAFQVLRRIVSLCDAHAAHATRLSRRLVKKDVGLAATEAKAFAVHARAKDRRNREARRFIDQAWRGRRKRRRESG